MNSLVQQQLNKAGLSMISGDRNTTRTKLGALLLAGLIVALFVAPMPASGARSTRHTATKARHTGWANVILVVRGACTPQRETLLRKMGAYVYRHLPLIHGLAVRVPARNQARIAA